jgi:hypothetical protein
MSIIEIQKPLRQARSFLSYFDNEAVTALSPDEIQGLLTSFRTLRRLLTPIPIEAATQIQATATFVEQRLNEAKDASGRFTQVFDRGEVIQDMLNDVMGMIEACTQLEPYFEAEKRQAQASAPQVQPTATRRQRLRS